MGIPLGFPHEPGSGSGHFPRAFRVGSAILVLALFLIVAFLPTDPGPGAWPATGEPAPLALPPALAPLGFGTVPGGNTTLSASSWPGVQGGGNLSGTALSAAPSSNSTLWQVYTGARVTPPWGPSAAASPVVANGIVYESTGSGSGVVALSASTGTLLWSTSFPLQLPIYGGLLVADHMVLVPAWQDPSNGSGVLHALNASTGAILWSASVGVRGPLLAPPNLVDGVVLEADAGTGYAYGWSESGNLIYSRPLGGPVYEPVSVLSPQQPLALAIAGSQLVAYNATNGLPFPGVLWSPLSLSVPSNGSVAQTHFSWAPNPGKKTSVPLAVMADNAGDSGPSQVEVLAPLGLPSPYGGGGGPVLASWTSPASGDGFAGAPAVLGQRGDNLTFALVGVNGTLAVFRFSLNATGAGSLVPEAFVPWTNVALTGDPMGSPIATGGPGGNVLFGTPMGQVLSVSVATRSVDWRLNGTSPVLSSPALAGSELYIADEGGTLRAIGGGTTPPSSPRLLLTLTAPPWVEGSTRANLTVDARVWYPNGSQVAASGAKVTVASQPGNITGSPGTISAQGIANFTLSAPAVSKETNATLFVNASWGKLTNSTSGELVLVPPRLVNNTPLSILASPLPPPSVLSGQQVLIVFQVGVGPGGGPLAGALASFTAFGGTVSPASGYTNASGAVSVTFVAGSPSSGTSTSGLTITVEKAGYEIGSYSWVTTVNPQPSLVLQFTPGTLLVLAGATTAFQVTVNSTANAPVENAVVYLKVPALGGNLSTPGGLSDARGEIEITYTAPSHVPSPGSASFLQVSATASGFTTVNAELPLTVVPNGTAPSGPSSGTGSSSNPLAGLPGWAAWGLIALVVVLFLAVLVLAFRRPPPPPKPRASVWEEWEAPRAQAEATPGHPPTSTMEPHGSPAAPGSHPSESPGTFPSTEGEDGATA